MMFGVFRSKTSLVQSGLLSGFTDFHSHILYGVDDGIKTAEESLSVLKTMEANGVKSVWCTPHIMEDVPNTTSALRSRFEELKSAWTGSVELHLASENMIDNLFVKRLADRDLLTFDGKRLLVETSTWAPPIDLWEIMDDMLVAGYTPVLAHPERYRYMKDEDYRRLLNMGVVFQLNLPSILGVYGPEPAAKARTMLQNGWYSIAGTDCHRLRALEGQVSCKILSRHDVDMLSGLIRG